MQKTAIIQVLPGGMLVKMLRIIGLFAQKVFKSPRSSRCRAVIRGGGDETHNSTTRNLRMGAERERAQG